MSNFTVPNTFVNGAVADAAQVNANFASIIGSGNNIDSTNMGAAGIYASSLIPTTALQATFGGVVAYTVPVGLTVIGPIRAASDGANPAYIPPVYTASGAATASTIHFAVDSVTAAGSVTTVTLSGASVFASAQFLLLVGDAATGVPVTATAISGSSFSFPSTSGHTYVFLAAGQ